MNTENTEHPLLGILAAKNENSSSSVNKYERLGLLFNPFPKSGTASLTSPETINRALAPFDDDVLVEIRNYIRDSLYINSEADNKFLSGTITGNYGSGKTQLLLYIQYLLNSASTFKVPQYPHKNPFVVYIDNPGVKLSELIGSIVTRIGEENFRKFIWDRIIYIVKTNPNWRTSLAPYEPQKEAVLFPDLNPDPYSEENTISYKKFLDVFIRYLSPIRRREFTYKLTNIVLEILSDWQGPLIAKYFHNLITEDTFGNQAWELLAQGTDKSLSKKEVDLINAIIDLTEKQGYTDFYILVDEFEDLTQGRLSKTELDNYLKNLRTLIDHNRKWCVVFAMTDEALLKVRQVSPPLADRLTNRRILLRGFDDSQAVKLVNIYLNLARPEALAELKPFTEESIKVLRYLTTSNLRRFLKGCFELLERFVEQKSESEFITPEFVKSHVKVSE